VNLRTKMLLVLIAFVVRLLVAWAATGHGEMEGLADRYQKDAYAVLAGYGFTRPVELQTPQVDLIALAAALDAKGVRISPEQVPPIEPARWRPSGLHPPLYAYFLAGVYMAVGNEWLFPVARTLQALVDALACLVVFGVALRLAGPWTARFAAWAYALFLPAAYIATSRVADSFMPVASVVVFALWVRALETRRLKDFVLSGVALGVANLIRPDLFLYPVFLGIVALWALRGDRQRALVGSGCLGAAMLLVMVPWALRNHAVYGEFKFTTNAGGATMLQTVGQLPNPYDLPVPDESYAEMARNAGYDGIDDPGADRMFKQRFLKIARENPGLLIGQAAQRLPMGLVPLYRWGYVNEYYESGHSFYDFKHKEGIGAYQVLFRHPLEILRAYWDRLLFGLVSFVLLIASLIVIWIERRRLWAPAILFVPWVYVVASHLPISMGARLMVPIAFCQLIALGYLLARRFDSTTRPLASFVDATARP
jgi:4-amino-4-deoxy-L-arabinose transferase-like glycosyltransferase